MDAMTRDILESAGFEADREDGIPTLSFCRIATPLGQMLAGAAAQGLCLLEFLDRADLGRQLATLRDRLPLPYSFRPSGIMEGACEQLSEYFEGKRREFSLPLIAGGTAFQEAVWEGLRRIPWGETRSYGELAGLIGRPGSARAVGTANARNRIAILIPCHRVLPSAGGGKGGYAGGSWRKERLLALEASR